MRVLEGDEAGDLRQGDDNCYTLFSKGDRVNEDRQAFGHYALENATGWLLKEDGDFYILE